MLPDDPEGPFMAVSCAVRVCLIYDCLFPYTVGGAERWYRNLAERLAAEGHDVTYLTLRQWERGERLDIDRRVRVVVAGPRMDLYTGGRRRILPPLVFGAGVLWHLLRHGWRYDVVHTCAFPYFSLLAAALVRPLARYKLVTDWFEVWSRDYWRGYLGGVGGRVGELVQRLLPRSQVVKAFNIVTAAHMVHPRLADGTPDMLIAGDDAAAKARVAEILEGFGWRTPIDVGPILRECLWSKLECAVLTSATLAVGGGFEYIRQRLGLEHARESVLPSHFDYENQALFYVPPDLPDARTPQFTAKAAERIRQLLEITRGRAFVLFTSYAQMNEVYQRLLGELEFPMLRQGDAPKSALLEEFRLTPNAVLFATSSFWQGVDVQGEQLSCVIIDRLPFAVPSDPAVAARVKAIDADGGNAFFQYQVPAAVITLKQGFGRLIRSLQDRGLLVLLDNRILKKQYGRVFIESLPNYRKTTEMRVVEEFFGVH